MSSREPEEDPSPRKTTTLLLIDVQNDFHPGGSLAIPTAHDDAERIAVLIRNVSPHRIVATLDTHHALHIAHPHFWRDGNVGTTHPEPFTIITSDQVERGIWKPRPDLRLISNNDNENCGGIEGVDPAVFGGGSEIFGTEGKTLDLYKYCVEYTKRLEEHGRFQLCIWPPHCLVGSAGHAIVPVVHEALLEWSRTTGRSVEYQFKGETLWTEMYSALCAEVPVNGATNWNDRLAQSLLPHHTADRLLVCGQALSHCVNYTVRDLLKAASSLLAAAGGGGSDGGDAATASLNRRIFVLTDCTSAVPGFEDAAAAFLHDAQAAGVQLITSSDLLRQEQ